MTVQDAVKKHKLVAFAQCMNQNRKGQTITSNQVMFLALSTRDVFLSVRNEKNEKVIMS